MRLQKSNELHTSASRIQIGTESDESTTTESICGGIERSGTESPPEIALRAWNYEEIKSTH
jgi:hypothetical protein